MNRVCGNDFGQSSLRGITTGADCGWDISPIQLLHYRAKEMAGVPHASMTLRLYRKNSIKLMLAWETCCRFSPLPTPVFLWCDHADSSSLRSMSGLGSGVLFSYPQIATIAGVQGLVVYALSSALPLLVFAWLGPIIRRKCPEGFVLTEWTRRRYGVIAALYLSALTYVTPLISLPILIEARLITLFLYMVAELSALQQIINALTGLNGLPAVIVECAVTTIYTSLGGFRISFITDNIQGAMVVCLIIIASITVGVETHISRDAVSSSGLLDATLLGWQLIYILPVAILTNDFFISGFWMRTFASKTDKDLHIGVAIATVALAIILTLVGVTGLLAAWSGESELT
jgi:Na+/proline symporter